MAENCGCKYDAMARVPQEPVDMTAALRKLPAGAVDMTGGMHGFPAGCEDMTRRMRLHVPDFAQSYSHKAAGDQACTCDKPTIGSSAYAGAESMAETSSSSFPASYVPRMIGSEDAFPIDFKVVTEGGSEVLRPSSRLRIVDPRDPRRVGVVGEDHRTTETSSEIRWVR